MGYCGRLVAVCYGLFCGELWYLLRVVVSRIVVICFVIVWQVVIICYGYGVASSGNDLWVIGWKVMVIFMGEFVASGGNLLWVIVWRVVVICYGLICVEWW